jgi:hypothetical protein
MDEKLITELKQVAKEIPNELFLFGKSLRNLILKNVVSEKVMVLVKGQTTQEIRDALSKHSINFSYVFGEEIPRNDIQFTIDDISLKVTDTMSSVIPTGPGFTDLTMGVINLLPETEKAIETNPRIILDTLLLLSDTGFSLNMSTMKTLFFQRKHLLDIQNKREIYRFLVEVFVNSKKTRKIIATINTIGVASVLFGQNLFETAILNHLNKKDIEEFFSIIFRNVEIDNLRHFLVNKVGFADRDTNAIIEISTCIRQIENEDDVTARRILNVCGKDKIQNLTRLLKALGYKTLSKLIKDQKEAVVSLDELDLTVETIKISFRIEDIEAKKLLDLALNKVITEPSYNEKAKLLSYLNKERKGSL